VVERNLALEVIRVTEAAALAAARLMGRGDNVAADEAAVTAMRKALNYVQFKGRVVIGEGERDEAPMLFIGEEVGGSDSPRVDIAVDPLEGTSIVATGGTNALAVIAIAEEGGFLHAPDTYMQKLAVGPKAKGAIDITASPTENLRSIAKALKKYWRTFVSSFFDRPATGADPECGSGARIKLIGDGDVAGAIATSKESGIDVLMGIGGAPEACSRPPREMPRRGFPGDPQVPQQGGIRAREGDGHRGSGPRLPAGGSRAERSDVRGDRGDLRGLPDGGAVLQRGRVHAIDRDAVEIEDDPDDRHDPLFRIQAEVRLIDDRRKCIGEGEGDREDRNRFRTVQGVRVVRARLPEGLHRDRREDQPAGIRGRCLRQA
jgi:hypothetical protein